MKSLILLFGLFALGASAGPLGRVLRIRPSTKAHLQFLQALGEQDVNLDFWTHPSHVGSAVDVRVTDDAYPRLAKRLNAQGIVFTIHIPDVDALSVAENPPSRAAGFNFQSYHTYQTIYAEMDNLVQRYSQIATMLNLGNSYENRPMKAVKISSGKGKKTFFINCGIHAREWITQATCMYMLNQMLTKFGQDQSVTDMVNKMDFVIMPALNVDGYHYTHTVNRMWRKTRSRNAGSSCMGTDPNRNWNYRWGGIGTSSNPCSDTYHGSKPFSEIESVNVARYLYRNKKSIVGYMDIHAYSQLWMTPWGYVKSSQSYPKNYNSIIKPASDAAVAALRALYGTTYKVGPSSIIIYATSGSTMDWAMAVLGIDHSYGLELRDTGRYGFRLPANQIIPTGKETFAGIKALITKVQV